MRRRLEEQPRAAGLTIRPIVRYPDLRLTQPAAVLSPCLTMRCARLADDLRDTMHAAPGIGITAPHIGVLLRVVVLDLDPVNGAHTYVNPEIAWASPELIMHQEGQRLDARREPDDIQRHARVRISYQDLDGNTQTEESDGLQCGLPPARDRPAQRHVPDPALSRRKRERLDQAVGAVVARAPGSADSRHVRRCDWRIGRISA